MKKIMSIMLGLTLAMGAVTVAFAQDKADDTSKKEGKKKGKKKEDKKEETK
jgi:ribosomal protein L12E/L44/L45/RPP1/RPP2